MKQSEPEAIKASQEKQSCHRFKKKQTQTCIKQHSDQLKDIKYKTLLEFPFSGKVCKAKGQEIWVDLPSMFTHVEVLSYTAKRSMIMFDGVSSSQEEC